MTALACSGLAALDPMVASMPERRAPAARHTAAWARRDSQGH